MAYVPLSQQQSQFIGGKNTTSSSGNGGYTPLSQQQAQFIKTNTQPAKPTITPVQPVKKISTPQNSLFGTVQDTVRNIGNLALSFVAPKLQSPIPQQDIVKSKPTTPQPIKITPDQTKIDVRQIRPGESTLSEAPKKTPLDIIHDAGNAILDFLAPSEGKNDVTSQLARAQNAYAIAKTRPDIAKGVSLNELAKPGGNPFHSSTTEQITKKLGIRTQLSNADFTDLVMALSLPVGFAEGGVKLALNVGKFMAVSTAFDTAFKKVTGKDTVSQLLPEDAPTIAKIGVDALEFLGKAYATHGINKVATDVKDAFTKTLLTKYDIPEKIQITPEGVRRVVIGIDNGANKDALTKLGLSSEEWKKAAQEGISVTLPTEKVTQITDKPLWKTLKSYIGLDATNITKTETLPRGEVGTFGGYLESGEHTPSEVISKVMQSGKANTEEGKQLIKTAMEARKSDQNILIKTSEDAAKEANVATFEKNIKEYRSFGGYTDGKSTENAALRDVTALADTPEVKAHTQMQVKSAINTGILPVDKNGDITLYRGGNPSSKNALSSATYNKEVAQTFADNAGLPVTEFKVKPEDIKAFIGRSEAEVLVPKEKVAPQVQLNKLNTEAQVPVGEGKKVRSRAYERVYNRMVEEGKDVSKMLSPDEVTQNRVNMRTDSEKAVNFVAENPDAAIRVALGLEKPPDGQLERNINLAVADKALQEGNIDLWNHVEATGSLRQTRRGKEIAADRGRFTDNSPHTYMKELINRRLAKLGGSVSEALKQNMAKAGTVKDAAFKKIDEEVSKIREKIKKDRKKIGLAQDFIDKLKCK